MAELITETLHNTPAREEAIKALRADVQAARQAMRWSQNEFARQAGVNGGVLSGLLSGTNISRSAEKRVRALLERLRKRGKLDGRGAGA